MPSVWDSALKSEFRSNLVTYSLKPTSRPRSMSRAVSCEESAISGTSRQRSDRRISLANSNPLLPGISMSEMITSKYCPELQSSSAASAFSAVVTL